MPFLSLTSFFFLVTKERIELLISNVQKLKDTNPLTSVKYKKNKKEGMVHCYLFFAITHKSSNNKFAAVRAVFPLGS